MGKLRRKSRKSLKRRGKRERRMNNLRRRASLKRRKRRSKLMMTTMICLGRPQVLKLTKRKTLDMKNLAGLFLTTVEAIREENQVDMRRRLKARDLLINLKMMASQVLQNRRRRGSLKWSDCLFTHF
jgi:hypothetical protein